MVRHLGSGAGLLSCCVIDAFLYIASCAVVLNMLSSKLSEYLRYVSYIRSDFLSILTKSIQSVMFSSYDLCHQWLGWACGVQVLRDRGVAGSAAAVVVRRRHRHHPLLPVPGRHEALPLQLQSVAAHPHPLPLQIRGIFLLLEAAGF